MQLLVLALLALLSAVDAGADADCNRPTPVLAFNAAFSAALSVTLSPDTGTIQLSGVEAAKIKFEVVYEMLTDQKICGADRVAFTVSKALVLVVKVTAPTFISEIGANMATFLYKHGKLTCDNAVALALEFAAWVKRGFGSSDPKKFETLEYATVYAIVNILPEKGFPLQEYIQELADLFYDEVVKNTKDSKPHCPAYN